MEIRVKLIEPTKDKLVFVKLIRECTDLGLSECKYFCDDLHNIPYTKDIIIKDGYDNYGVSYLEKLKTGLKNITGSFTIDLAQQLNRNIKLLKLGLGDYSDYVVFIEDYIVTNKNSSIFNLIMSKLSKEDIVDIFNEVCKNVENND